VSGKNWFTGEREIAKWKQKKWTFRDEWENREREREKILLGVRRNGR